jgi:hypothetical protein
MADLLDAPFLVRKLITGKPVTAQLAHQIVTLVLDGSAPG